MTNENQYLNLLKSVIQNGTWHDDRTGTGTYSLFGGQMRFDLREGFPILTTKKVFWRGVVEELLWMLRGESNVKSLQAKGIHIWDEWADRYGDLGPVYGAQWRNWNSADGPAIDQIKELVDGLVRNPNSRRHIVTAWNPEHVPSMALPPCHCFFQCKVEDNKYLSLQLYQRSCDMLLGVPFNISSYSLLTHILADCTGLVAKEFIHTVGDYHVYSNHVEQCKEQLSRQPKQAPTLIIQQNNNTYPWEYKFDDFGLNGYDPHPAIKAEVSV